MAQAFKGLVSQGLFDPSVLSHDPVEHLERYIPGRSARPPIPGDELAEAALMSFSL